MKQIKTIEELTAAYARKEPIVARLISRTPLSICRSASIASINGDLILLKVDCWLPAFYWMRFGAIGLSFHRIDSQTWRRYNSLQIGWCGLATFEPASSNPATAMRRPPNVL